MNPHRPSQKIVDNADFFDKASLDKFTFKRGTRFFMQTDDYVGEFMVTEEREEQGSQFRLISGPSANVVVMLHYLQREAVSGNIKIDEVDKTSKTNKDKANEDDNSGKSDD